MGMLDRIRDPKAGVAPALSAVESLVFVASLLLVTAGVSSTRRRNCVLFMVQGESMMRRSGRSDG